MSQYINRCFPKGVPLAIVRVDFSNNQPAEFASAVSGVIHSAMQEVLGVPPLENYIVCQGYPKAAILHAPGACSPDRLENIVFVQITLNQGRSAELKAKFFSELNKRLVGTGYLQTENIFINLVEVARENWSFGIPNV